MDHLVLREGDLEVDLESGGTTSKEESMKDLISANRQTKKNLNGLLNFDGTVKGECVISSCSSTSKLGAVEYNNLNLLIDKNSEREESCQHIALMEKKCAEGKHKKTNSRKPPKPPRPPKGPSLNAADQKLAREIAELAIRKRVRIERIKALKRMKGSSNSSLYAMIITILFCLIIICQGMFSRSSSTVRSEGSPAPAVASNKGLISVQFYKNFSPHERDKQGSSPFNLAEKQVLGSGSKEDASKVAR